MGSFYTTQIAHQVLCDNERQGGEGVEGGSRGGDICIFMADSHCCAAEINTTV